MGGGVLRGEGGEPGLRGKRERAASDPAHAELGGGVGGAEVQRSRRGARPACRVPPAGGLGLGRSAEAVRRHLTVLGKGRTGSDVYLLKHTTR